MSNREKATDLTPTETHERLPNRNIKERLNLHVKRRLQETVAEPTNIAHHNQIVTTTVSKRGAHTERGSSSNSGRGGKKLRIAKNLTATNLSMAPSTFPDDECSRDGNFSCTDLNREKVHSPDVLTMVLNQKKLSLFNDPQVKDFLDGIIHILGNKAGDNG